MNRSACARSGFTLTEVVMAMSIGGLMMAGTVSGYIQCMRQVEWASYSFAANSLAMQKLEQTRAAKWDRLAYPAVDAVVSTNFPVEVQVLDVPTSKTNVVYATNYTTITTVSTTPPLKMIRVDCTWQFLNRGVFTNTIATYRAPEQ